MNDQDTYLEKTWGAILSRNEDEIERVYLTLDEDSRKVLLHHLEKMASEDGWHPEQVKSARAALRVIRRLYQDGHQTVN